MRSSTNAYPLIAIAILNFLLTNRVVVGQSQTMAPTVVPLCVYPQPYRKTQTNTISDCSYTGLPVSYIAGSATNGPVYYYRLPCQCGDGLYCLANSGRSLQTGGPGTLFYGLAAGVCHPYVCDSYSQDSCSSDRYSGGPTASCTCSGGQSCIANDGSTQGNTCGSPTSNTLFLVAVIVGPVLFCFCLCGVFLIRRWRQKRSQMVSALNESINSHITHNNTGATFTSHGISMTTGIRTHSIHPHKDGHHDGVQVADELERLVKLRDQGGLTEYEFSTAKAAVLGTQH